MSMYPLRVKKTRHEETNLPKGDSELQLKPGVFTFISICRSYADNLSMILGAIGMYSFKYLIIAAYLNFWLA